MKHRRKCMDTTESGKQTAYFARLRLPTNSGTIHSHDQAIKDAYKVSVMAIGLSLLAVPTSSGSENSASSVN